MSGYFPDGCTAHDVEVGNGWVGPYRRLPVMPDAATSNGAVEGLNAENEALTPSYPSGTSFEKGEI